MTTITELKQSHPYTDLVEVARRIPAHRAGILLCDETHVHVYTAEGVFSIEWIDCEDGGPNHEAMAAAIEAKLGSPTLLPFVAVPAARLTDLAADLAAAQHDLRHAATETWRVAARRTIKMIEAEIEELG